MLLFSIDGLPVSWKAHGGYGKKSFNPRFKEKEFYQWQIKSQCNQDPISGPVSVEIVYHMPIPKGTSKIRKTQMLNGLIHHISRPDTSNLTKFLEDCLKTIVIVDDSQIWHLDAKKIYSLTPKTVIKINPA